MGGFLLVVGVSLVMAVSCFLAGILPLSLSLSSSQLRLISSIGMGVLVGTSLIVIIPEGIEAVYSAGSEAHFHTRRSLHMQTSGTEVPWASRDIIHVAQRDARSQLDGHVIRSNNMIKRSDIFEMINMPTRAIAEREDISVTAVPTGTDAEQNAPAAAQNENKKKPPTFLIGFSLIMGFILMFLIDKLPRHASENLQPPAQPRHISLNNLSQGLHSAQPTDDDIESESFLHSLAPTPKQSRSLATTTGLVIHAFADGIAMGASASSSDTSVGLVVFLAIMIHKAPAAFGLTSVLLKHGLSKRAARGHLIVFSLASPLGAISTFILVTALHGQQVEGEKAQFWTGMLLLFSAGTFLYVAMHAMQEESGHHDHSAANGFGDGAIAQRKQSNKPQIRDTIAAACGMLVPLLTQIGHHD
ncbi:ZIP metal ion transporter-like protein [Calycina marina]|uniref:ZIP metal ion transporter-like protein n=1 Tax=Calycina marina TaxID=1763456 RepID=A0A9P7Z1U8_9HELO|nr:ZIP metal ion transporter-like protein [Calycina marina]